MKNTTNIFEQMMCAQCNRPWLGAFWGYELCNTCSAGSETESTVDQVLGVADEPTETQ